MTPKAINRDSGRIFEGLLLPTWAFRSQEDQEDYGVDGEIEITTSDDKATGFIFKIQLKGIEEASYDSDQNLVFGTASVEKFRYYLENLDIPILFVVADLKTSRCFWCRVQGNNELQSSFESASEKGQQTFTLRLTPNHTIIRNEQSASAMMQAVTDSRSSVMIRNFGSISGQQIQTHFKQGGDPAKLEQELRARAGVAASIELDRLADSGKFVEAERKARSILNSTSEIIESRIFAGVSLVSTFEKSFRKGGGSASSVELPRYKDEISHQMVQVIREESCRTGLRDYVFGYARSARLAISSRLVMGLCASQVNKTNTEPQISDNFVIFERISLSQNALREFARGHDRLAKLFASDSFYLAPYLWIEWAEAVFPLISGLRIISEEILPDKLVRIADSAFEMCLEILRHHPSADNLEAVLTSMASTYLSLHGHFTSEAFKERYANLTPLLSPKAFDTVRSCVFKNLEAQMTLSENFRTKESENSLEDLVKYYRNQASILGVDLDDPDDDIAWIVRIGLQDLDPTRVLKDCQHMYVVCNGGGIPAEMLNLPTAGSKRILCLKHGHSVSGMELDKIYPSFRGPVPWAPNDPNCSTCPNKTLHPEGWNWSFDWEKEQHERYRATSEEMLGEVNQKKSSSEASDS